jgi:hypothetical protein
MTLRHKLAVLAEDCEQEGRAYATSEKTLSTRLQPGGAAATGGSRRVRRPLLRNAALGIQHIVISSRAMPDDALATVAAAATAATALLTRTRGSTVSRERSFTPYGPRSSPPAPIDDPLATIGAPT